MIRPGEMPAAPAKDVLLLVPKLRLGTHSAKLCFAIL